MQFWFSGIKIAFHVVMTHFNATTALSKLLVILWACGSMSQAQAQQIIQSRRPLGSVDYNANQKWKTETEQVYRVQDGSWVRLNADGSTSPIGAPSSSDSEYHHTVAIGLAKDSKSVTFSTWNWSNDKASLRGPTLGGNASYDSAIRYSGRNFWDTRVEGSAAASARANLADANANWNHQVGDDSTNVKLGAKGNSFVGANANANINAKLNRQNLQLGAGLGAFAGVEASGSIPLSASLCDLLVTATAKAKAQAGAGANARANTQLNFGSLTFKLSAQAAASLGLGAGLSGDVLIDLSAIAKDPEAVGKCIQMTGGQIVEAIDQANDLVQENERFLQEGRMLLLDSLLDRLGRLLGHQSSTTCQ